MSNVKCFFFKGNAKSSMKSITATKCKPWDEGSTRRCIKEAEIQQVRYRVLCLKERKAIEEIKNIKLKNALLMITLPEKLGGGESDHCSLVDQGEDLIQRAMERAEIISPGKVSDIFIKLSLNCSFMLHHSSVKEILNPFIL